MKRTALLFALLCLSIAPIGCSSPSRPQDAPGGVALVENGKSDYVIVTAANASPSEKHAAAELQRFIREISGAELPIVTDAGNLQEHEIILGQNAHLKPAGVEIDFTKLGNEGFTIRTSDERLIIAGSALRGTIYGVYTFLENYLNCRWFSSRLSRIPENPTVVLAQIDDTQVPVFEYRDDYYTDAFDGDWSARNRMNSSIASLKERHGGKVNYFPFVHSFYTLLPPDKHFAEHPEYYSEQNGKRFVEGGQLCLTNPDVVRLAIEQVKQWIRERPEVSIISISQNDSGDFGGECQCAKCKAMDESEGSPSATVVNFVNQIAEAVEKDHPGVAIDTLAYRYTRKPPKTIRPRPNVIIRLCSIECCFSHPLDACPENASFVADIQAWAKICNRLYIWDYVTNFANYLMPFPNFNSLAPNIRFFARNNVRGVFEEGNYAKGGCGEFAELRAYVLAKLLWNPEYDVNKAVTEFMETAYGPAAPAIRRYFDILHTKAREKDVHTGIYDRPKNLYLTPEVMSAAVKCFEDAEAAVAKSDEETRRWVHLARLPVMFVQIVNTPFEKRDTGIEELFFKYAEEYGVTHVGEGEWAEIAKFKGAISNPRPVLGVQLAPAPNDEGILVNGVTEGSAAAEAGMAEGDVIVEINGKPVTAFQEIVEAIRGSKIGAKVTLKIKRGEEVKEVQPVLKGSRW
jgi:hypothetical protein